MPEATTLYSVTGVVLVGLVAWVAMVLKQAKEPWARVVPEQPAQELDAPEEKEEKKDEAVEAAAEKSDEAKLDADDTARATPVALSEGRQKTAEPAREEDKEEEKKDEPAAAEEEAKKEEAK